MEDTNHLAFISSEDKENYEIKVKRKGEGNKHCCWGECRSDSRYREKRQAEMNGVFFIPFPKPLTKLEKCEKWIKLCATNKLRSPADVKRSTYICSLHFVGGKGPTDQHPDPISARDSAEQVSRKAFKRPAPSERLSVKKRRLEHQATEDRMLAARGLLDLGQCLPEGNLAENEDVQSQPDSEGTYLFTATPATVHCSCDAKGPTTDTAESATQTVYDNYFLGSKIENIILKNELGKPNVSQKPQKSTYGTLCLDEVKGNDKKMKYFTGLTYVQFMALFNFLGDSVNNLTNWSSKTPSKSVLKDKRKMSPVDQLFITLVRLRRGFGVETMSHLLGLSEGYISTIFCTWIQFLYSHFNELREQMFPERNHFTHFMPKVFKTFKNIRCSIDCTEFFVQMPRDFGRQGNMYSSYKHHHTYKCLIATAPNGAIVYVSDLFEGSISDRSIVEKSGFLNYLNPGDLILADRGFTIDDMLMPRQVSLNIPPFLGKRTHLTPRENLKTRRIAKARIHVERVIERVKKFQLISGIIPLSLSPILNQLVFVCSCLVNFQKPIVT